MLKSHALRSGAQEIAEFIAPIETSFDDSLMLQARLLAHAPEARAKANLPASVGHQAIVSMVAAISATVTAKTAFLEAHRELAAIREDLRIPITGLGSLDGCPSGAASLTVVASAA